MISQRKVNANRANARASTGPKTAQGRARSARNALRHGLSLPVEVDPVLSEQIEAFAREMAGLGASKEIQHCARKVAEAQIDVQRVRSARHQMLLRVLPNLDQKSGVSKDEGALSESGKRFLAFDRYERRALSRRKFAIRELDKAAALCRR